MIREFREFIFEQMKLRWVKRHKGGKDQCWDVEGSWVRTLEAALSELDKKDKRVSLAGCICNGGKRQQEGQALWCDKEAAWGKTLKAALPACDRKDQRDPLSADSPEKERETAWMTGLELECRSSLGKIADDTGSV